MKNIKLNWWDHVYCFVQTIWWICRYGIDEAMIRADKEIEELERKRSILENWRK